MLKTNEQKINIETGIRLNKTSYLGSLLSSNKAAHPVFPAKSPTVFNCGSKLKSTIILVTNNKVDNILMKFLAKNDLNGVENTPFTVLPNLPSSKYIPKKCTDRLLWIKYVNSKILTR